jgi:hypothetical protein
MTRVRRLPAILGGLHTAGLVGADFGPSLAPIPSSSKEAYAFALRGFFTLNGLPANVPSCTGAGSTALLGNITTGRSALVLPAPAAQPPNRLLVSSSAGRHYDD